ncbi:MAG TPA: hypothetical protein VD907_05770, partial [Verrucomicrobiae bacterium]|nr:hypothetical protein [Verrucomicrobiae bacterium]
MQPTDVSCTITLMENGSWQFNPGDGNASVATEPLSVAVPPTGSDGTITWTASEFVAHHKSSGWYALLALCAVGVAFIVW